MSNRLSQDKITLSDKQQSFVEHYCTDAAFNASLAYKMAYPLCKSGHKQAGSRLLTNVDVMGAIDKKKAGQAEKLEITAKLCTQRFDDMYWHCMSTGDNAGALRAIENHAKHKGYYEADKDHVLTQVQVNVAKQQAIIAEAIALGKALDEAPDAMAK